MVPVDSCLVPVHEVCRWPMGTPACCISIPKGGRRCSSLFGALQRSNVSVSKLLCSNVPLSLSHGDFLPPL